MSYDQKTVSKGLDSMPYNKRFKVPEGALPFIKAHIEAFPYGGGINLNHDYTEYYKNRLPDIRNY